jgi:hypothetical protein
MSKTRSPKPSQSSLYHVGDRVRLQFGSSLVRGVIVEDRGEIGVGGRRLLRVRLELDPASETFFIEVPDQELQAA